MKMQYLLVETQKKVVRHHRRHKDVIVSKLRANKIIDEMTIMFVQLKMKPKILRAN